MRWSLAIAMLSILLGGCVAIFREHQFASKPPASGDSEQELARVRVVTERESFDALPIAIVFYDRGPHDLKISVLAAADSGAEGLVIHETSLRFADGETVSLMADSEPIQAEFRCDPEQPDSGRIAATHRFPDVVTRVADFELHVKATLRFRDGTVRDVVLHRQFSGSSKTSVQDFVTWTSSV
jgi:hypothetical protein